MQIANSPVDLGNLAGCFAVFCWYRLNARRLAGDLLYGAGYAATAPAASVSLRRRLQFAPYDQPPDSDRLRALPRHYRLPPYSQSPDQA